MGFILEQMRVDVVILSAVVASALAAPDGIDSVHSLMEPALSAPRPPRLKSPYAGAPGQRSGLLVSLGRLVRPPQALLLLPAGLVTIDDAQFFDDDDDDDIDVAT